MSVSKRVQFSDKRKVKNYDRDEDSGSGEEYDLTGDDEKANKKSKHSLDSDEEDNVEKYEILNKNVLNGLYFKSLRKKNSILRVFQFDYFLCKSF